MFIITRFMFKSGPKAYQNRTLIPHNARFWHRKKIFTNYSQMIYNGWQWFTLRLYGTIDSIKSKLNDKRTTLILCLKKAKVYCQEILCCSWPFSKGSSSKIVGETNYNVINVQFFWAQWNLRPQTASKDLALLGPFLTVFGR